MTYVPRAALPDRVLYREDAQEALARRDFGQLFALARKWGGISYSAIAESCEIKPERVGRLAQGDGEVRSYDKILQIADGMRIPGYMLGLLPRPWELPPEDSARGEQASPQKAESRPISPGVRSAEQEAEVAEPGTDPSAEWFDAELQRLESDYDAASSAVLLTEAGQLHGALKRVRTHRSGSVADPLLMRLQARSALLLGQLVWDASHRRDGASAAAFFDEATLLAETFQDRETAAQAQLRKAFIPLYGGAGDARTALSEAHRAANTAIEIPSTRALALLHMSEGSARLGHREDAQHYLALADRIADQAEVDEDEWNGRSRRIAGSVFLTLAMPQRAQTLLEGALPLLEQRKKSQALATANLALAHLRQADLDQASATLHQAMDLVEATGAGGALTLIAAASRELGPWRHEPSVADVRERLFDLLAH